MPEVAIAALRRLGPGSGSVFRTANGKPPRRCSIDHNLRHLCREVGLARLNLHGLRHVHAMLALEATSGARS